MRPFIVKNIREKYGEFIVLDIIRDGTGGKNLFWGFYKGEKSFSKLPEDNTIFVRFCKSDEDFSTES